jgi:hypothetical protein
MDTFCICEVCREKVDPADPGVVRAVEVIELQMFGPTNERLRGLTSSSTASTTRAVPPTTS